MEPIRIKAYLPPMLEPETAVAKPEGRPNPNAESEVLSAPASSTEGKTFQASGGDEVQITFESGEQRMAFLTGELWKPDTPPTSASPASGGTPAESGTAEPAPGHKGKKLPGSG